MNYIIDPSVFYWINVLSIANVLFGVFGGLTVATCLVFTILYFYNAWNISEPDEPDDNSRYETERYKRNMKNYREDLALIARFRKWSIATGVVGLVLVLLAVFIPGKQTCVEMLIAKTATFDNVNWTVSQVKEVVDYIVKALKGAI